MAVDSTKVYQSPQIVVTATRLATPYDEVASSITALQANEIDRQQLFGISDVLRQVAGISVSNTGGLGRATSIYTRGANSDHTLVLLDGVELNDPSAPGNAYDFGALLVHNIDRIEVLRGAQSTLFGSNAIGGVVNILTKKGVDSANMKAAFEGGAYNTYSAIAALSGASRRFDYSLSARRFDSDGFSAANKSFGNTENDGYENTTLSTRLGFVAHKNVKLDLFINYVDATGDLDKGGKQGDDPNNTFSITQLASKASAHFSHFQDRWQHSLTFSLTDHEREASDEADDTRPQDASLSTNDGRRVKIDWQHNFFLSTNNTLTFGLETEQEKAESTFRSESAFGPFSSAFPSQTARNTGVYLQDQIKIDQRFFATLGARYDKHSEFGDELTYRLGLAYRFNRTNTRVKGTLGTGFNAPTLFEIFDPAYGNPDLEPEKSIGWDIGIEQIIGQEKMRFGASYFVNEFDELIGFDENFRSINIDAAESHGVEIFLKSKLSESAGFHLSYTFTETEDKSENSPDKGEMLLRRPKHQFNIDINSRFLEKGSASLQLQYSGKKDDLDFTAFPAARVTLDGYFLTNLAASFEISQNLTVFGRIENLFNENYEEVLYFGTPGRAAYVGVKTSF